MTRWRSQPRRDVALAPHAPARLPPYETSTRSHTLPSETDRQTATTKAAAMKKLRLLLAATESSESESTIDGEATSPATTIHATQGVTVVLTVAVDGARLARTVAIRWHRARARDREGLQRTGTEPAYDAGEGAVTTITYSFAAELPGTFTYRARYGRDRAACLADARGGGGAGPSAGDRARTDAEGPSAGGRPRTHAAGPSSAGRRRARAAARRGVVRVNVPPRRAEGPPNADNRVAGRPGSTAVRRADGRRGMACVEAQLMGDCPVIYYDGAEYDGGAPVLRLLRWSAAALAAAALWVSGICGPRDPDMHMHRRAPQHPATLC